MAIDLNTAEFLLGFPLDEETKESIAFLDGLDQDNDYFDSINRDDLVNRDYGEDLNELAEVLGIRHNSQEI